MMLIISYENYLYLPDEQLGPKVELAGRIAGQAIRLLEVRGQIGEIFFDQETFELLDIVSLKSIG